MQYLVSLVLCVHMIEHNLSGVYPCVPRFSQAHYMQTSWPVVIHTCLVSFYSRHRQQQLSIDRFHICMHILEKVFTVYYYILRSIHYSLRKTQLMHIVMKLAPLCDSKLYYLATVLFLTWILLEILNHSVMIAYRNQQLV